MRVVATVGDNLAAYLRGEQDAMAARITAAVDRVGRELRDELRGQIRAAFKPPGPGNRVRGQSAEKMVRHVVYPQHGRKSMGAASLVTIPWRHIRVHEEGAVIRGRRFLAIPTAEAERLGLARGGERRGSFGRFQVGNLARGAQVQEAFRRFRGRIKIARSRSGYVIGLTLEAAGAAGVRGRRKTFDRDGRREKRRMVPLFVLVPQVTLRPRLDIAGAERRALDRLHAEVAAAVGE